MERKAGILAGIDTRTKAIALIALVAEASFLGALSRLPSDQVVIALAVCAVILVVSVVGMVLVEYAENTTPKESSGELVASPLTASTNLLDDIVNSSIQTVCRAVSLPMTPESAKLRVFIFRAQGGQLVCSHHWSPNPVKEQVGVLRFDLDMKLAEEVAVVRAAMNRTIARSSVRDLPDDFEGVAGDVADDLNFVLAAPIFTGDDQLWGTVDFDAASEEGRTLLSNQVSEAVMYQLAQHLKVIFGIQSGSD